MSYAQALDGLIDVLRHVNALGDAAGFEEMTGCSESATTMRRAIRGALEYGSPYYWAPNTCAVLAGVWRDMPDWTLRAECLPSQHGYFHFADPLTVPCPGDHGCETDSMTGLVWATQDAPEIDDGLGGKSILIWPLMQGPRRHAGQFVSAHLWVFGTGLRGSIEVEEGVSEEVRATCVAPPFRAAVFGVLAAALAFMEQRILVSPWSYAPRSTRKRSISVFKEDRPVRVVQLRRAQQQGHGHQDAAGVEWSCQWLVSGHWRQQPCGKDRAERRPTFILPYVKGNPDKPMRLPAERVFAVVR